MPTLLLLLMVTGLSAGESYKPSSRKTHTTKRNQVIREDSRENVVQFDIPKQVSQKRRVHPPITRQLTPIPMYRQDSTVGFTNPDWRSSQYPVALHGGGGGPHYQVGVPQERPIVEAQDIDINVRGMQRLEGRSCCARPEGQRRPSWFLCLFGMCVGRDNR